MLRPASHLRDADFATPLHLLLGGPETHGVNRYAGEVGGAAGAHASPGRRPPDARRVGPPHVTDRLIHVHRRLRLRRWSRWHGGVRLTVTLHDVPQPTDGPVFEARAAAYGRMVRATHARATNSWHEHAPLGRSVWRRGCSRATGDPPAGLRHGRPG